MYTLKQKILLFNLVCIPVRIGILLLVYFFPERLTSILTFIISFGFFYRYFSPTEKGIFETKVYWSRLFHSITYLATSVLLLLEQSKEYAFWILVFDVSVGFLTFWNHYIPEITKNKKKKTIENVVSVS